MSELKLLLPVESWRGAIEEFKQEYVQANSAMDGTSGLSSQDFDSWLEKNIRKRWLPALFRLPPICRFVCLTAGLSA